MKLSSLLCWLMVVIVPVTARPQSQQTQASQEEKRFSDEGSSKIRTQVQERGTGENAKVKVTLQDKSIVKGYISQVDAESFRVTDKKSGQVTTIAYKNVAKVKKSGMSTGAKVGIGVGVAAAALVATAIILGSIIDD
jgi:hypothetical protein